MLADGKTTFEVATYNPGDRWPEAWTSGAALASPRGGAILTGHPVKIGDLIQITGAMPNGQIKGNCLIWDIEHDLVVWDVKPELRAWKGQIYLSVLNELHGGPANLDVQTASNLDLAKVRDHKLIHSFASNMPAMYSILCRTMNASRRRSDSITRQPGPMKMAIR